MPAEQPHHPGRKRACAITAFLGIPGLLIVLAILVVAVGIPIYNLVAKRAYESHVEHLQSMGESLEIEDHLPPPVPDPSDNFAEAELVRKLEREAESRDAGDEGPFPLLERLMPEAIPEYTERSNESGIRYHTYGPLSAEFPGLDSREAAESILDYCREIDAELAAFEEAVRRPSSNLGIEYEKGYAAVYSGLSPLFEIADLQAYRGRASLELGDDTTAARSASTLLHLQKHLGRESSLTPQLVAQRILEKGITLIQQGLREDAWTAAQRDKFERLLAGRRVAPGVLRTFRMERAIFVDYMFRILERHDSDSPDPPESKNPLSEIDTAWALSGRLYDNARKFSEILQEEALTDAAGDPLRNRFSKETGVYKRIEDLGANLLSRSRYLYVVIAFPVLDSVRSMALRTQTYLGHARLALALEDHRAEHDGYPASLAELDPPFPGELPTDFFAEAPYRYERFEDGTYQIHGIGPNRKDEDGRIEKDREAGDWVWRLSLPEDFDRVEYHRD